MIPKFVTLTWTYSPNFKPVYLTSYLTSPFECLLGFSNFLYLKYLLTFPQLTLIMTSPPVSVNGNLILLVLRPDTTETPLIPSFFHISHLI